MPEAMDHHERMRMRNAAFKCGKLYPPAVAEVLSREILTWEEFGYRLNRGGSVMRLVDFIIKEPIPRPKPKS